MKLIEAMKKCGELMRKVEDLKKKVAQYHVRFDYEQEEYKDQGQTKKVREWLDSIHDTIKEITRLRIAIQLTNLTTDIEINIVGQKVKHSIAEWMIRRGQGKAGQRTGSMAALELSSWMTLDNRGITDGFMKVTSEKEQKVKVIRHYDIELRDKKIEFYKAENEAIDAGLEVANATHDIEEADFSTEVPPTITPEEAKDLPSGPGAATTPNTENKK